MFYSYFLPGFCHSLRSPTLFHARARVLGIGAQNDLILSQLDHHATDFPLLIYSTIRATEYIRIFGDIFRCLFFMAAFFLSIATGALAIR